MSAERPLLPAPHQVISAFVDSVFGYPPNRAAQPASITAG